MRALDSAFGWLGELLAMDRTLLLTEDHAALAEDPTTWQQVITADGWIARGRHQAEALPADSALGRPEVEVAAAPLAALVPDEAVTRAVEGGYRYRGCRFALVRSPDTITLTGHGADDHLLWRQRWPAPALNQSPSQHLDLHQGVVLVAEGGSRVRAFDCRLGTALGAVVPERADLDLTHAAWLSGNRLALLGPLGVRTQLTLLGRSPEDEQVITLPTAARWLLPLGSVVAVALEDGRVLTYPGVAVLSLPEAVAKAPVAPVVMRDGLLVGDQLHRWINR